MKSNNLQDKFLAQLCRSGQRVSVFVTNGFQVKGKVVDFDAFTILLAGDDRGQNLIFKHAISTIRPDEAVCLPITSRRSEME